ncbi:MAG: hypothetical protein ABJA10_06500 [Aestuariivirga sp.]
MSYSPARLDENAKLETDENGLPKNLNADGPVPGWFASDTDAETANRLVQRYRDRIARQEAQLKAEDELMIDYRRNLDARFKAAKQLYDRPGNDNPPEMKLQTRRPTLPLSELEGRSQRYTREATQAPPQTMPIRRRRTFLNTYATSAIFAMALGGAIGFGYANRTSLIAFGQDGLAQAKATVASLNAAPPSAPAPMTSGSTTIAKKPIAMASLSVNDAAGTLNSMIPLALTAHAASAEQPVEVLISGMPASAYLTAGRQVENGNWLVKAPEIADLKLVIPQSETSQVSLEVAAVEQGTSNLAAPAQKLNVELSDVKIEPASAPPDAAGSNVTTQPALTDDKVASTQAQPIPQPVGADLLARADGLMNQGDIISARQYYMQAATAGNPRGILGVARTYDPKVFAEMKIEGLQPDATKAAEWYKKAQAAGLTVKN